MMIVFHLADYLPTEWCKDGTSAQIQEFVKAIVSQQIETSHASN